MWSVQVFMILQIKELIAWMKRLQLLVELEFVPKKFFFIRQNILKTKIVPIVRLD